MQLRDARRGFSIRRIGAASAGRSIPVRLRGCAQARVARKYSSICRLRPGLTQFDFDFSTLGYSKVYRIYFEVRCVTPCSTASSARGSDVQAFRGEDLLVTRRVTPYDAFAVWMPLSYSSPCRTLGWCIPNLLLGISLDPTSDSTDALKPRLD